MSPEYGEQLKLKLPKIIAIVGREGCGKDVYGQYLSENGYLHISAGDVLRELARAEGYSDPIPRKVLGQVGDKLKAQYGANVITEWALSEYRSNFDKYPNGLVISGLRRTGEVTNLQNNGGVVLWIEADDSQRFEWIKSRKRAGEPLDYDSFIEKSESEYHGKPSEGGSGINLEAVEILANCRIMNDSTKSDLINVGNVELANYMLKKPQL